MQDVTVLLLVVLAIGFASGFWVGRRWSERSRARFEQKGAWNVRTKYRGTRPF